VDYLGVATIDEGLELRGQGISAPVLVMSGMLPWDELRPVFENKLTPVVYDFASLKRILENGSGYNGEPKVHIKVDTGMGRLGFTMDEVPSLIGQLKRANNLRVEGLMSHFSSSETRDEYGLNQVSAFREVARSFKNSGIEPELFHMANSGAIVNYPEAHLSMVRVGISLYGSYPGEGIDKNLPLKQVMKYVTKVAHIRDFPAGYPLSYGRTFVTERKTRIAYLPVGYADGYPRALSNRGCVLIKDRRCSIVGRICMDWTLADVTELDSVQVGEDVILMGHGECDVIRADEIAQLAGTIPYEILCKVSKRIPRVYVW